VHQDLGAVPLGVGGRAEQVDLQPGAVAAGRVVPQERAPDRRRDEQVEEAVPREVGGHQAVVIVGVVEPRLGADPLEPAFDRAPPQLVRLEPVEGGVEHRSAVRRHPGGDGRVEQPIVLEVEQLEPPRHPHVAGRRPVGVGVAQALEPQRGAAGDVLPASAAEQALDDRPRRAHAVVQQPVPVEVGGRQAHRLHRLVHAEVDRRVGEERPAVGRPLVAVQRDRALGERPVGADQQVQVAVPLAVGEVPHQRQPWPALGDQLGDELELPLAVEEQALGGADLRLQRRAPARLRHRVQAGEEQVEVVVAVDVAQGEGLEAGPRPPLLQVEDLRRSERHAAQVREDDGDALARRQQLGQPVPVQVGGAEAEERPVQRGELVGHARRQRDRVEVACPVVGVQGRRARGVAEGDVDVPVGVQVVGHQGAGYVHAAAALVAGQRRDVVEPSLHGDVGQLGEVAAGLELRGRLGGRLLGGGLVDERRRRRPVLRGTPEEQRHQDPHSGRPNPPHPIDYPAGETPRP